MKKEEWTALILAATLLLTPLAGGVVQNFKHAHWQHGSGTNNGNHTIDVEGYLTLLVSGLTLAALIFQAWTNHRQRDLMRRQADAMDGQLVAANVSANAAKEAAEAATRASYADRAWLFIESINHTDMGKEPHPDGMYRFEIGFTIRNYGSTPAIIRQIVFRAFSKIRFFGGEPDPENLGVGVAEVEFGGMLWEQNSGKIYPMRTAHGIMGNQHQITVAPKSVTRVQTHNTHQTTAATR